jgi:hypothetical protein
MMLGHMSPVAKHSCVPGASATYATCCMCCRCDVTACDSVVQQAVMQYPLKAAFLRSSPTCPAAEHGGDCGEDWPLDCLLPEAADSGVLDGIRMLMAAGAVLEPHNVPPLVSAVSRNSKGRYTVSVLLPADPLQCHDANGMSKHSVNCAWCWFCTAVLMPLREHVVPALLETSVHCSIHLL